MEEIGYNQDIALLVSYWSQETQYYLHIAKAEFFYNIMKQL